jgi:hypothetical protein
MPPRSIQVLPNRNEIALLDASGREINPGVRQSKGFTDPLWCFLFLLALVGLGVLTGFGYQYGNPSIFKHFITAKDSQGRFCGMDDGVKDFKYAYYTLKKGSAPVPTNSTTYWTTTTRHNLHVVCTKSCPEASATAAAMPVPERPEGPGVCAPDSADWCTWYGANTIKVVHYCIDPQVFDVPQSWEQYLQDVRASTAQLSIVFPVAVLTGFLFLFVLEKCGAVFIWCILVLTAAVPAILGAMVFHKKDDGKVGPIEYSAEHAQMTAYILWGISAVIVLFGCCFAGTIRNIAAIIKCTSHFLEEVPSQLIQPFIFALFQLLVIGCWLACFFIVMSVGDEGEDPDTCFEAGNIYCVEWDKNGVWVFLYMLLLVYWMCNFLHACSHFGTSYAVGAWYFTQVDHDTGRKVLAEGGMSCCDVMLTVRAVGHGLRYHAGSLAYGAFCISLAKVCRLVLYWVSKDVEAHTAGNPAVRCCLCITNCLADCLERFIKFVSEHAYVEVALNGERFCVSAKKAMAMAVLKPALFTLVGRVARAVQLVGILVVTSISTYSCVVILWLWSPVDLINRVPVYVAAALFSLTIGEVMMHPFTSAARAVLHCYCLDEASNVHPMCTPTSLQRLIDEHESRTHEGERGFCGRCCPCC